jgi:multiple sugar transport system permease protein
MTIRYQKWTWTVGGLLALGVMLFPLYWTLISALQTDSQIFASPPHYFPPTPTLDAFREAFDVQRRNILNSLIVGAGTVAFSLIIATPAAYALAKFRSRSINVLLFGVLMAQMVPSVILANALFVILLKMNLTNTYPGLILADSSLSIPFNILVLRTFMATIPNELLEASRIDGASEWTIFTRIVIPISRSALITAGLFSFLFAWGDFLFALTIMTQNAMQPVTVSIYTFIGIFTSSWNKVMATAVLAAVPSALLLLVAQRYITAGLTSGAVKG